MRFQCPHCKGVVAIDDSEAGQAAQCGHCNKIVVVPPSFCSIGAVIDDFVINEELGRGGMGTVFLAHQMSLDRAAAVKILHPEFSQDSKFADELIREARAAAKLSHPNIVQAYAVGMEDNIYFFAMEYVKGSTLKEVLAHSGRIVVERSLMIVHEMAKALDFAWENQKLVHRDIKPDNIILTDKGQVKLADLGLARPASDLLNEADDEVMGTPQYISPEQLLGIAVDCRADIYCLGATLYHALTGRYPFTGATPTEVAQKHLLASLVPPAALVPDVPEAVSTLVEVMMAKRPQHRYQTPAELVEDLERLRRGEEPRRGVYAQGQCPIQLDLDNPMASPDPNEQEPVTAVDSDDDDFPTGMASQTSSRKMLLNRDPNSPSGSSISSRNVSGSTGKILLQKSSGGSSSSSGGSGKKKLSFESASRSAGASAVGKSKTTMNRQKNAAGSQIGADANNSVGSVINARIGRHRGGIAPAKKSRAGLFVGIVMVAVLGIGAIAVVLLSGDSAKDNNTTAPAVVAPLAATTTLPPNQQLQQTLTGMIQQQAEGSAILDRVVEFNRRFGSRFHSEPAISAQILPFDEENLRALRQQRHDTELAAWRQRTHSLQLQNRFNQISRELVSALPLNRSRLESQLRSEISRINESQSKLRQDLVRLCQNLEFNRARTEIEMARVRAETTQRNWNNEVNEAERSLREAFADWPRDLQRAMASLSEEDLAIQQQRLEAVQREQNQAYRSFFQELRNQIRNGFPPYINWLNDKIATINLAEQCFAIIHNSQGKYRGMKIEPGRAVRQSLPPRRHFKFNIDHIGRTDLDIGIYEDRLVDSEFVETRFKQVNVPLQKLSLAQIVEMYEAIWLAEHGEDNRDELNLKLGAYLLARADSLESLAEAGQRLLNSNQNNITTPMLAELDMLRPQAWRDSLEQLRRYVLEQETATAERYSQYLKAKFPNEYPQYENEIRNILAGR